ncbi:MAG: copper amine oxidase N-terminal domain-containing protein [Clostridiales bacterium]|nr:copper amine oxidase N-terminal domain-containing protein [Clostridiales bacterium]
MKKPLVIFLASILLLLFFVAPSFAESMRKNLEVTYNNIQLVVDGIRVVPRDVNGNIVEPFIYNGTTYLPVRAVSEALGMSVTWDGNTQTVYVSEKEDSTTQEQPQEQSQEQLQEQQQEQLQEQLPEQLQEQPQVQPQEQPQEQITQPQSQEQGQSDNTDKPNPTIPSEPTNITVFVSTSSKTIHTVSNCSGMKNYQEMTLVEARKISSSYCSKCAGHLKESE